MKASLAIRIDPALLEAARTYARRDNRTLTNFIETALLQRIAEMKPNHPTRGQVGAGQDRETPRDL